MSVGLEGFFQPSMRHWREYLDTEQMRVNVKPALGPGPHSGPIDINLNTGDVVIDQDAVNREEDLREQRRAGLA